MITDVGHFT